jgi:hypothetical protein
MKKDAKAPIAALIVAHMKAKDHGEHDAEEEAGEDESPEDEPSEGQLQAAQEMMDAFEKGDHHEFAEALHAFIQMCK